MQNAKQDALTTLFDRAVELGRVPMAEYDRLTDAIASGKCTCDKVVQEWQDRLYLPLRFSIGEQVECDLGVDIGWGSATVIKHWWRSSDMPVEKCAPYQMEVCRPNCQCSHCKLGKGQGGKKESMEVYAPQDHSSWIRPPLLSNTERGRALAMATAMQMPFLSEVMTLTTSKQHVQLLRVLRKESLREVKPGKAPKGEELEAMALWGLECSAQARAAIVRAVRTDGRVEDNVWGRTDGEIDADFLELALHSLTMLSISGANNRDELLMHAAKVMAPGQPWSSVSKVACAAVTATKHLTDSFDSCGEADDSLVGRVLDCLLWAMEAFPTEGRLQERAMLSLRKLTNPQHFRKAPRASAERLAERTLAAMAAFQDDDEVQSSGCSLLSGLADDYERFADALLQQGAGSAVLCAMVRHENSPRVQMAGALALSLSLNDRSPEAIQATKRALLQHPEWSHSGMMKELMQLVAAYADGHATPRVNPGADKVASRRSGPRGQAALSSLAELWKALPDLPKEDFEDAYDEMLTGAVANAGMPPDVARELRAQLRGLKGRDRRSKMLNQMDLIIEQLEDMGSARTSHASAPPPTTERPASQAEAFVPEDPRAHGMRCGDTVKVCGLTAKPELNGCTGKLIGTFDTKSGRFPVRIKSRSSPDAEVKMKPSNLTLVEYMLDDMTCDFVRPSGDIEGKDVHWCRTNGFKQVGRTVWAGDWWDQLSAAERESILARSAKRASQHHSSGWAAGLCDSQSDSDGEGGFSGFGGGGSHGFSADEVEELMLQGIKPWDPEARAAVQMLFPGKYGDYDDYDSDF